MLDLLLLLLLAHLMGDFVLQNDNMAVKKDEPNKDRVRTLLLHTLAHCLSYTIVFIILFYALHEFYESAILWIIILTASHFIIDWGKIYIRIRNKVLMFSIDQGLHIAIIYLIINRIGHIPVIPILKGLKVASFFETVVFGLIILILLTSFANVFIKCFLDPIKPPDSKGNQSPEDNMKIGRYIGSFERILAFLAVYASAYTVLIGIFGTKTAIRFKQFEEREFAEYYFIGTSLSALFAIVIGLFCHWLFI